MHDHEVRSAVRQFLEAFHTGSDDTRIIEEMGVWSGSVRIDIAVINGELSGFELKSDRDRLDRLPAQAALYSAVFDRVSLVVGTRHVERGMAAIPEWWGVIEVISHRDSVALHPRRGPAKNPSPDPLQVARLLWREEALAALEANGLATGVRSKAVGVLHQRLAKELPFSTLSATVRRTLKNRVGWLGKAIHNQGEVTV